MREITDHSRNISLSTFIQLFADFLNRGKRDSMNNSNLKKTKKLHFSQHFNYSHNQGENNPAYISLSSISLACLNQLRMALSSKTNGPRGKRNNPQTI